MSHGCTRMHTDALPSGFQLIAAYGLLVAVPPEWNPILLREFPSRIFGRTRRRGIIALADLRGTQLEVRWQTFPSSSAAAKQLQKIANRLERSQAKVERQHGAIAIRSPETNALQLLCISNHRLYELNLAKQSDAAEVVTAWFLQANPVVAAGLPQHLWSFYGCHGYAPREARISKLLLLPGQVEIYLSSPGTRIALGAFSLADRLLNGTSLLAWAKSLCKEGRTAGEWHDHGGEVSFTGTERSKLRRQIHHDLHFCHDAVHNRISWRHRQRWGSAAVLSTSTAGITEAD